MRIIRVTWFAMLIAGAGTAFAQAPEPDPTAPDPDTYPDQEPDVDVDVEGTQPPPPQPPQQPVEGDPDTTVIVTPPPASQSPIIQPTPMDDDADRWSLERIGLGLTVGGGVAGFTNESMRDFTEVGGGWAVRATVGTKSPIAFEGSYIGSLQEIDALGLDNDALLTGNGVQGALRLNATTDFVVQPFLFAGVGWRRYELTNSDFNTSDIAESDDVLELPVGIGFAFKSGNFMLDARGELRPTFYQSMVPSLEENDDAEMHQYMINANLGVQF